HPSLHAAAVVDPPHEGRRQATPLPGEPGAKLERRTWESTLDALLGSRTVLLRLVQVRRCASGGARSEARRLGGGALGELVPGGCLLRSPPAVRRSRRVLLPGRQT